jgi:murein hydrolase activator
VTALLRLSLLCLCLIASGAYASKSEDLENLKSRISQLQQELEKTSESKAEAADALRESERAISQTNRKLAELGAEQREATQTLATLRTQGKNLEKDVQTQQAWLGRLLYDQYVNGEGEYLKLLLNGRDPGQLARNMQYYEYIAKNRAQWIAQLRTNLNDLHAVADETQQKSAQIARLQAEQKAQQRKLTRDKQNRQAVLVKISQQLKKQRREIGHLQRNEARLSKLVERLSHMLAEPKTANLFHNEAAPDNRFDGSPFEELRGKLSLPVKGTVSNRFGTPRPESTVLWKGLFVRAGVNQPVKAVAAGRVVFADWLRGFGNLLIIDHGRGYMSLYGNNETLYKQVGEVLKGGDVVASVGNSGGNEDYGLYFELRHEGEPMDPMKWIAK